MKKVRNLLTIAGSDSGGGAGIQADLKTFMALGAYGTCAITALTAQNGQGVTGIFPVTPDFVVQQIKTVFKGFKISGAKTGMLFSSDIITSVAETLKKRSFPLVVDPVCVSQSGSKLLEDDAIETLKEKLLPLSDLLTPNLPEAELLTGISIRDLESATEAGEKLLAMGAKAVLIKGGHAPKDYLVTDHLFQPDTPRLDISCERLETPNNHGTGCTLSAAIATYLAQGFSLSDAVVVAKRYLTKALSTSYTPGKGPGPVNHAYRLMDKS